MSDIDLVLETLTSEARRLEYDHWPADWKDRSARLHTIVHSALMLKSLTLENERGTVETSA